MNLRAFPLVAAISLLAGCVSTQPASPVVRVSEPGDVNPAQPAIPARTFSLMDFGAVPDGKTPNTEAFKRAVEAVDHAGGGTLVVPAGIYFTGPVDLCSGLNLRIEAGATILFSPVFDEYREATRYRPLLRAAAAHDVMISGSGTINGSGDAWWSEARRFKAEARANHQRNDTSPRPRMVVFDHCQRVRVEGITLTNAPVFNLVPTASEDVTIEGVTILNPARSPNTDGIDPSVSRRVLISHCRIDTGDDCIAVKAGGKGAGFTEDILVTDCTFLHGHGCSIGSETYSGLRNMTVRRCTFDGTEIGVRLKSDRFRGGLVEGVTYTDLTMRNVWEAIVISSYYQGATTNIGSNFGHETVPAVTATTPHWHNIVIRNVVAVGCTRDAGMILGLPEMPADGIVLDHVSIGAPKGLKIAYTNGVTLHDVKVVAGSGPPLITDASVTGLIDD